MYKFEMVLNFIVKIYDLPDSFLDQQAWLKDYLQLDPFYYNKALVVYYLFTHCRLTMHLGIISFEDWLE